jgi:predicted transcriptional regulator
MERRPFTFRLEDELYCALSSLSSITKRSMNQLVTEAVAIYVKRTSREVERDLERTLQQLRQYSSKDPDFEQAIAAFAEAEVTLDDPLEGQPIDRPQTAQSEIDELLANG